jgi:hypothetical protein
MAGMPPSADSDLVLYGVVGLKRGRGGHGSLGTVGSGRQRLTVLMSESVTFDGEEDSSITVTSQRPGNDEQLGQLRDWAPMNTYLASPAGQGALAGWDRVGPPPRPVEVEWMQILIRVDGVETPFEMCDLGDGHWAAIGRVPGAILTIGSQGVPLSAIMLERLASREGPPPPHPDMGDRTEAVINGLNDRFARVPFARVHGSADYWALRAVEVDHVDRLAGREGLSEEQRIGLRDYWLRRIEDPLRPRMDRLRFKDVDAMHRSRIARHLGHGFLFQVWCNTVGPGGRCWFGNRYAPIRHHTFRIRWRP